MVVMVLNCLQTQMFPYGTQVYDNILRYLKQILSLQLLKFIFYKALIRIPLRVDTLLII